MDPRRKSVSANYLSVDWTRGGGDPVSDLRSLYARAPLRMQCQGGDGRPLPGHDWARVETPKVVKELQPEPRVACQEEEEEEEGEDAIGQVAKRIGFGPKALEVGRFRLDGCVCNTRYLPKQNAHLIAFLCHFPMRGSTFEREGGRRRRHPPMDSIISRPSHADPSSSHPFEAAGPRSI